MAPKKKKAPPPKRPVAGATAEIENAGVVMEQPITQTLETNYMPYAMSVIISRAIPEIDGFKPAHRKLLYTMYKMGLLTGARTKSANIVGQTMRLNPHGDAAIYETMVRLSRGNQALLHPYVDSKGNFGKAYSRDMAYAASRYTEAKLDAICNELFADIDKDTIDFQDNYDGSMKEPTLLPVQFPSILLNSNIGIAVGMASAICPFNLEELCDTTIALMKNPKHDLLTTLAAPDFPGGGYILYNEAELRRIYETGRGGVRVRARYNYDKAANCLEITEIPPTTTVEIIIDKIVELVKSAKVREVADIRDETDLSGLKIAIDLKRGIDPDKLMQKLFRMTSLEDTMSCNFNVLISGYPRVMGARELLEEWIAFREECVKRRVYFDLKKKKEKLHLLLGLSKILLDIDKAIRIVRETEEESEVVMNLMIGFGIDEIQAEYVAEIKLRHLNREYILKRIEETESLKEEIVRMEGILGDQKKVREIIVSELQQIKKKYAQPRRSLILYDVQSVQEDEEEETPDYPVNLFFTREGYFKKITPQSLRMSSEQKLKEGDEILSNMESTNRAHLLFFTDHQQVYKSHAYDFDDTKASVLGDYVPAKLGFEEGERIVCFAAVQEYTGYMMFFFRSGKAAKVEMSSYETKTNRKKLTGAYSGRDELAGAFYVPEDREFLLKATGGRMLIVHTGAINPKQSRDTQGVAVMSLKRNALVDQAVPFTGEMLNNEHRFRTKSLPAAGAIPRAEDLGEQMSLLD
ncbi:MAG: DNA topoisomerase (ATP-hydrolyzing) subunit A [Oscillospiraceae bacterium]|nr:DNA topoisomerase (ATP-hydrolyzing) subunit A [Oscillospiraceae bacterium]